MIIADIRKAKMIPGEYSVFLSFPYSDDLISVIHQITPRSWDKPNTEWEIPLSKLGVFVNGADKHEIQLKGELSALLEKKVPNIKFDFKTKPFDHQIDGFNFGLIHNAWLLGDEQGLGKTWQVINIAIAKKKLNGYKHCLIVCGVNGLKWNWVKEIHTHSNEDAYILGQRGNKIGSNADKLTDINNIDDRPYFIITNVETLRDDKIAGALQALCNNGTIGMIAIDEVHKCKNPSSQQGKGILKLNAETKIAMTGTPLLNTPLDLYIILKWLGYEKHSFYAFKNHFCVMGGYGNYQIVGYQNLKELEEQIKEIMLRRLKADVLDLPEKLFVDEYVELGKEQAKVYTEIQNDLRLNVDKIATSPNPLAQLIRLRQATGFTGILSSDIAVSAKLDRMEELVEEAVANGKKVVVFSNWTQITDEVMKRLRAYNPAIITGDTADSERPIQENKFQHDDTCKVIVGTIGAMGTGLTLTAGSVEIFLDEPWTAAMKSQAVDRCHRIGANENVTIYTLLTKNTIDERIHEIVYAKGQMSDALIDGKVVGDKRQIVDYLLA